MTTSHESKLARGFILRCLQSSRDRALVAVPAKYWLCLRIVGHAAHEIAVGVLDLTRPAHVVEQCAAKGPASTYRLCERECRERES